MVGYEKTFLFLSVLPLVSVVAYSEFNDTLEPSDADDVYAYIPSTVAEKLSAEESSGNHDNDTSRDQKDKNDALNEESMVVGSQSSAGVTNMMAGVQNDGYVVYYPYSATDFAYTSSLNGGADGGNGSIVLFPPPSVPETFNSEFDSEPKHEKKDKKEAKKIYPEENIVDMRNRPPLVVDQEAISMPPKNDNYYRSVAQLIRSIVRDDDPKVAGREKRAGKAYKLVPSKRPDTTWDFVKSCLFQLAILALAITLTIRYCQRYFLKSSSPEIKKMNPKELRDHLFYMCRTYQNILIGTKQCPYCGKASNLLKKRNKDHTVILLDDLDEECAEVVRSFLTRKNGNTSCVPQIFLTGRYVGGYTALLEHLSME